MGWLYMQSLKGHSGPKQYFDAQCTFSRPEVTSRVLRSALVNMRVYYAAVEIIRPGAERTVFAAVCLVRYNPRDREGYIFGYKDMDETVGPNESACPAAILNLLTPTEFPYAKAWRQRCREHLTARRKLSSKPSPRPGQTIVFDQPVAFQNGCSFDRFEVASNPRSHRTVLFREPQSGGLYRIRNVKKLAYCLLDRV
jgi:hypothetical protein